MGNAFSGKPDIERQTIAENIVNIYLLTNTNRDPRQNVVIIGERHTEVKYDYAQALSDTAFLTNWVVLCETSSDVSNYISKQALVRISQLDRKSTKKTIYIDMLRQSRLLYYLNQLLNNITSIFEYSCYAILVRHNFDINKYLPEITADFGKSLLDPLIKWYDNTKSDKYTLIQFVESALLIPLLMLNIYANMDQENRAIYDETVKKLMVNVEIINHYSPRRSEENIDDLSFNLNYILTSFQLLSAQYGFKMSQLLFNCKKLFLIWYHILLIIEHHLKTNHNQGSLRFQKPVPDIKFMICTRDIKFMTNLADTKLMMSPSDLYFNPDIHIEKQTSAYSPFCFITDIECWIKFHRQVEKKRNILILCGSAHSYNIDYLFTLNNQYINVIPPIICRNYMSNKTWHYNAINLEKLYTIFLNQTVDWSGIKSLLEPNKKTSKESPIGHVFMGGAGLFAIQQYLSMIIAFAIVIGIIVLIYYLLNCSIELSPIISKPLYSAIIMSSATRF